NLRLKGASIFWCRASAEAILLLRSYYKAGRWNLLKHMATAHQALLEAWSEKWEHAPVTLSYEVECDEASVMAGHKGPPEVVKSKDRQGRRCRLQGKSGRV